MKRLIELRLVSNPVYAPFLGITKQQVIEFNRRTFCTSYMLTRMLGPFDAGKVVKIGITVMSSLSRDGPRSVHLDISKPGDRWISGAGGGSMVINRYYDLKSYFKSSKPRQIVFDILRSDITAAAEKHGWDVDHIKKTFDAMAKTDLKFYWEVGKPKLSPNRKRRAIAILEADEWNGKVSFRIEDIKTGECKTVLATNEPSNKYDFEPWHDDNYNFEHWQDDVFDATGAQWLGNERVTLARKRGLRKFSFPVDV